MYFNNHLGATTENDIVAVFITLYSIGEGAEGYAALLHIKPSITETLSKS